MSKILLVEDYEMNRDMLTHRLERKGFEVVIAVDGQADVNMATTASPCLILMDLSHAGHGRQGSKSQDQGRSRHTVDSYYCTHGTCHGGDEKKALRPVVTTTTPGRSTSTVCSTRSGTC